VCPSFFSFSLAAAAAQHVPEDHAMKRHPFLTGIACMLIFCIVFVAAVWAITRFNLPDRVRSGAGGKVAVIDVEGIISESRQIIERIHTLRDDTSVRAVVVRVDSPGGTVGPAQEIYEELMKLQQHKPVITSMGSVAASGGYYIAAGTQKIFANPGTITGSIGVLIEVANIEELFGKIGLRSEVIKSGEFKDTLSPTRSMQTDERGLIQALVNNIHGQFVDAVARGRGMPREDIMALADGRILSGQQALEAGLVDELGNLYDAIQAAADMAGIEGTPNVLYPPKKGPSVLDFFMEAGLKAVMEQYRSVTAEYIMFR
jgi:protease IV